MTDVEMSMGIQSAYLQALKSFREGGVPVGSALLVDGGIASLGHNRRLQRGSNILHGEMDCIENAGHYVDFTQSVLFTTLSPCLMCAHSILLFRIPRLVVLDDVNTKDFVTSLDALRNKGVQVTVVEHKQSIDLNSRFQSDPSTRKLWMGDVGV
ncbi:MAG TPA: nucleoside deaminase [Steroidobacteraceae bacterium]|jgi:cytosine deaminase